MVGCTAFLLSVITMAFFCPAVGQAEFTVSVAQDVYQAEENSNITLTWLFPVDTDASLELQIDVWNVKMKTPIYFYDSRYYREPDLHELYRGRLQCDLQLARKGRIECLLTHLSLNDTGTYQCLVIFNEKTGYKPCDLIVIAAMGKPVTEMQKSGSRERIGFYAALGLFTVITLALSLRYLTLNTSVYKSAVP